MPRHGAQDVALAFGLIMGMAGVWQMVVSVRRCKEAETANRLLQAKLDLILSRLQK